MGSGSQKNFFYFLLDLKLQGSENPNFFTEIDFKVFSQSQCVKFSYPIGIGYGSGTTQWQVVPDFSAKNRVRPVLEQQVVPDCVPDCVPDLVPDPYPIPNSDRVRNRVPPCVVYHLVLCTTTQLPVQVVLLRQNRVRPSYPTGTRPRTRSRTRF